MADQLPTVEFYEGIAEAIDGVSLRQNRGTGERSIVLTFNQLRATEQFQSFRSRFAGALRLADEEGAIAIEPEGMRLVLGGPEGDELQRVECTLVVDRDDHWDRLMRFLQRYAAANGMAYGESPQGDGLS
jgi:photosystem II Psb28-2 protein